jgi:hypothetical protein
MADANRGAPAKHYPRSMMSAGVTQTTALYRLIHGQTDLETAQSLAYFASEPEIGDEVFISQQMLAGESVYAVVEIDVNYHELYGQRFRQLQLKYLRQEF